MVSQRGMAAGRPAGNEVHPDGKQAVDEDVENEVSPSTSGWWRNIRTARARLSKGGPTRGMRPTRRMSQPMCRSASGGRPFTG